MKKGMLISLITGLLIVSIYYWSNHRQVQVIDAHHNTWTAEIVVDHFPFSKAARIEWWENNNESILKNITFLSTERVGLIILPFMRLVKAISNWREKTGFASTI